MFIKQEYKIYAYYICAEEKLLSLIFAIRFEIKLDL